VVGAKGIVREDLGVLGGVCDSCLVRRAGIVQTIMMVPPFLCSRHGITVLGKDHCCP